MNLRGGNSTTPHAVQANYQQCPRTDDFDCDLYQQVLNRVKFDTKRVTYQVSSNLQEGKKSLKILKSTTNLADGRFGIGLMWKDGFKTPNNRIVVDLQLRSSLQRLNKYLHRTNSIRKPLTQISPENISPLPKIRHSSWSWTFTVCSITNIDKSGKVRRVTYASSKYQRSSLNSSLLTRLDRLCKDLSSDTDTEQLQSQPTWGIHYEVK